MKVLIVDDDLVLSDLVAFTLRREGFEILQAQDGLSALQRWETEQPDIVVLDINLPKTVPPLDGFAVCRRIREQAQTPIILLTVRENEDDIVKGFKLGADDYIVKPFSPRQLVARINAVLRRAGSMPSEPVRKFEGLTFNLDRREVLTDDGRLIQLTALENRLLDYLVLNTGRILTYEDIIERVWGPQGGDRDMLRQLIRRLRSKIEPDPTHPVYIETVAGLGYGFRRQSDG